MRLLFVTNRNIITTSGELRLIKNRAEALFSEYNISTDFLVFQKESRVNAKKKEIINAGGSLCTYTMNIKRPVTSILNYCKMVKTISNRVKKENIDAVIFSGPGLAGLAEKVKKVSSCKVIIDVHGSSEDIVELTKNKEFSKRLVSNLIYRIEKNGFKKGFKYADGCFVVTGALADYIKKNYHTKNIDFFQVPCATTGISEDIKYIFDNRKIYREKYGIKENEIVFIYSGGVSSWQCVEETVELYKRLKNSIKKPLRLLCFSHNKERIQELVGATRDVVVDSYLPHELEKALFAGDFAFMLRKNCITNNVAFPNKYLEYVKSGMKIITTPYVFEIANQITDNGVGFLYDFSGNIQEIANYVEEKAHSYGDDWNQRNIILNNNSFKTRLKPFVAFLWGKEE